MFLNFTGKKCCLIVFLSFALLGKTGHSYKEAVDGHRLMPMALLSSPGPAADPLTIKVLTVSGLRRVFSKDHVASFSPEIPATFFILGGEEDTSSSKHPKR